MKPIKDAVGVTADVLSILAFVGLSAAGAVAWLQTRGNSSWLLVGGIFGIGVVVPLVARLTIRQWGPKVASWIYRKTALRFSYMPLSLTISDLRKLLPSDELIKKLYAKAVERVHAWDPDARVTKVQFSIVVDVFLGARPECSYRFYIDAESSWKKRKAEFIDYADRRVLGHRFYQRQYGEDLKRPQSALALDLDQPFYEKFPDWRERTIRSYGPIESLEKQLVRFDMVVTAKNPNLRIKAIEDSKNYAEAVARSRTYHLADTS